MLDKVCINFVGGALGHLVLKSIYHHWPHHFQKKTDLIDTVWHTNHQVQPSFFLRSYPGLSPDELLALEQIATEKNSILLCHNANLVPLQIKKSFAFINIHCDESSRTAAGFLFMIKSGYTVLEWARKKQKENFDPYEIMFKEFCRMSKEKIQAQPGINLDFHAMQDYCHMLPALKMVQKIMMLDDHGCHQEWYDLHYANSIQPLVRYSEFFQYFQRAFALWISAGTDANYKKIMHPVSNFEHLVDFFFQLHGK